MVFCHSCGIEGDSVLSVALLTEETDFQWIWYVSCGIEGTSVLSVAPLTEETDFQWIWYVSCGIEGPNVLSVAWFGSVNQLNAELSPTEAPEAVDCGNPCQPRHSSHSRKASRGTKSRETAILYSHHQTDIALRSAVG